MMKDKFDKELQALFADADASLAADPFVANTTARIRRMELARRGLFALLATIGVLIIGSQLPALLGALSGVDAMPDLLSTRLSEGVMTLVAVEPFWLAVGGGLLISFLATFMVEQV